MTAENFIAANKGPVEEVANVLVERKDVYGDELVELLNQQRFVQPEIDLSKEETWPRL